MLPGGQPDSTRHRPIATSGIREALASWGKSPRRTDDLPKSLALVVEKETLYCWSRHDLVCPTRTTTGHGHCRHFPLMLARMHPAESLGNSVLDHRTTLQRPPMPVASTERSVSGWEWVPPSRAADWAPSTTAGLDIPSSSLRRDPDSNPAGCSNYRQRGQSSWDSLRDHWMPGRLDDLRAGTAMEAALKNIGRGALAAYMTRTPCRDPRRARRKTGLGLPRLSW